MGRLWQTEIPADEMILMRASKSFRHEMLLSGNAPIRKSFHPQAHTYVHIHTRASAHLILCIGYIHDIYIHVQIYTHKASSYTKTSFTILYFLSWIPSTVSLCLLSLNPRARRKSSHNTTHNHFFHVLRPRKTVADRIFG